MKTDNLTRSQIIQLMWYFAAVEVDGSYYGNQEYFKKRHEAITAWLTRKLGEKA